jgi:hypothetical protein
MEEENDTPLMLAMQNVLVALFVNPALNVL